MIDFGRGVYLDTLDEAWAADIRSWRNDPRIWKWCRQHDLIPEAEHRAWFSGLAGDASRRMYAIMDHESQGLFVGVCGFTSIDQHNRRAEFSLYIKPDSHGCGFGRRALATLLDHGFRNLNLNVIWGESYDKNPACETFVRIGMSKEGTRREFYFRDGKYIDAHLYSIKATEWLTRQS